MAADPNALCPVGPTALLAPEMTRSPWAPARARPHTTGRFATHRRTPTRRFNQAARHSKRLLSFVKRRFVGLVISSAAVPAAFQ